MKRTECQKCGVNVINDSSVANRTLIGLYNTVLCDSCVNGWHEVVYNSPQWFDFKRKEVLLDFMQHSPNFEFADLEPVKKTTDAMEKAKVSLFFMAKKFVESK